MQETNNIQYTFVAYRSGFVGEDGMVCFSPEGAEEDKIWVAADNDMVLEYFNQDGGWVNPQNIHDENPAPNKPELSVQEYYKLSWSEYPAPVLWIKDWEKGLPGYNGEAWLELDDSTPEALTPNGNDAWVADGSRFSIAAGRYQRIGWHFRAPIDAEENGWRRIELSWNDVTIFRD